MTPPRKVRGRGRGGGRARVGVGLGLKSRVKGVGVGRLPLDAAPVLPELSRGRARVKGRGGAPAARRRPFPPRVSWVRIR